MMILRIDPLRDAEGPARLDNEDLVQCSARLFGAQTPSDPAADQGLRLWWSFPRAWASAMNGWADPWVIGLLFPMMACARRARARVPVRIEGRVSPSLLENLENYMRIWQSWVPDHYFPVDFQPEQEIESPPSSSAQVLTAFSGGVDSCYTVWEHVHGRGGRLNRTIGLAVIMHGFDVWLDYPNAAAIYAALRHGAQAQLRSVGIDSIPMVSNFHELPGIWGHSFGTQLVSGLHLLGGRFRGALIANNLKFNQPNVPWGSTPLIDRYLSSNAFPIMDYGGEAGRFEKLAALAHWPEALAHLRVCFANEGNAANCCRCEKCVRNIIACRIMGLGLPPAFARDVSDRQIAGMKFHTPLNLRLWEDLLTGARVHGKERESWARALQTAIRRGQRRLFWQGLKKPLIPMRNNIRRVFRGSAESRSARNKQ